MPWALAMGALLATTLALGPPLPPDSISLCLAIGLFFFEITCVRLPLLGLFSAGPAFSLALIQHAGGGLAALAGCLALGLRQASKRQWLATIIDLLPLLVACLVGNLMTGRGDWLLLARQLAVPVVYLAVQAKLYQHFGGQLPRSDYLAWLRLQILTNEMRLVVVLASIGLANLPPGQFLLVLLPVPLWATHKAVSYGIFRLHSKDATRALATVDDLQRTVERAQLETDQARRELKVSVEDKRLLEEMSQYLTSRPDPISAFDHILQVCRRLGGFQSLAIFYRDAGGPLPVRYKGPDPGRVEGASLLGLREPLIEDVFARGQAALLRQDDPNRIFSGELAALALPLGQHFALYAGRASPPFSESECTSLLSLAARAGPILEATQQRYHESRQLQHSQQQSQVLAGQVNLLNTLLACSQHLFSSLEGDRLLQLCEEALHRLLPHHSGQIWLQPGSPARQWGEPVEVASLVAGVVASGRPLLLPQLNDGSGRSCLCAPFPALQRNPTQGAVVLLHDQSDAFRRDHQDALTLLVQQFALAMANAAYLRQVIETQSQLIQSSKMTAVGQLAAGVAHELNSPLGAIALAIESAATTIDNPNTLKKLQRAGASTDRCRRIVEKLLIYTRLGAAVREGTDLKEMVEDTLDFFAAHLDLDGYQLHLDLESGVLVPAVTQEIQQILVSLLLNAKESYLNAPELPKKIAISCGRLERSGFLMVRDAGVGIAPEDLPRVFEPFFTNKTIGKNIGLGLSVALEIARQHGGELVLKSSPGQGTAARLSLPLS